MEKSQLRRQQAFFVLKFVSLTSSVFDLIYFCFHKIDEPKLVCVNPMRGSHLSQMWVSVQIKFETSSNLGNGGSHYLKWTSTGRPIWNEAALSSILDNT